MLELLKRIKALPGNIGICHFCYADYTTEDGVEMSMIIPIMYTNEGEFVDLDNKIEDDKI